MHSEDLRHSQSNNFYEVSSVNDELAADNKPQDLSVTDLTNFFLKDEVTPISNNQFNIGKDGNALQKSITGSEGTILDTASQAFKSSNAKRIKKHRCTYPDCNKMFSRPSVLKEHIQTKHLNIRKYKCTECDQRYTKKLHLQRHYISAHSIDNKPFKCTFCDKKLLTKQHLETHERTHTKPFRCKFNDQCEAGFTTQKLLDGHVERAHLSKHEEKLTCQFCKQKLQSPSKLQQHILKKHNDSSCLLPVSQEDKKLIDFQMSLKIKRYQCSTTDCNKTFTTWSLYQQHMKNDHPKLECLICKKKCVGETGLQMHMMVHDDSMINKIWKCLICQEKFAKKNELSEHCKSSHELDIGHNTEQPHEDGEDDEYIVRKKIKTTNLDLWKSNIKILNKINSGESMAEVLLNSLGKKYQCSVPNCYRKFKNKETYQIHLEKHEDYIKKMSSLERKDDGKED